MVFLPGTALDGLVTRFDAGAQYVAVATPEGRLKVFDALSGNLHSELGSSSTKPKSKHCSYTSVEWAPQAAAPSNAQPAPKLLVAGSSSGDVSAFDVSRGVCVWSSAAVLPGAVQGVAFDSTRGRVLAVGKDGTGAILNAATGSTRSRHTLDKRGLSCCCVVNGGDVAIVGGTAMSLVDTESAATLLRLSGHSAQVRALAATPDGAYAVSAAAGDRNIAVFSLALKASTSSKPKVRKSKGLVPVEHAPVSLACAPLDTAADGSCAEAFQLLAVTEAGSAHVWECRKEAGAVKATLRCSIHVSAERQSGEGGAGAGACVLAAAFDGPNGLAVAKGAAVRPQVERLQLPRESGASIKLAPPTPLLKASSSSAPPSASAAAAAPAVLGTDNNGHAILPREVPAGRKRSQPDGAAVMSDADFHRPAPAPGSEGTLGERIAALSASSADPAAAPAGDGSGNAAPPAATAASLSVLLTQALHAQDAVVLEKVLSAGSPAVIRATVSRLAPADAIPFLVAAVARLQARPARAAQLLPWLRATALSHASFLAAAPAARAPLAVLQAVIEERLQVLKPVLALRGRLDLVLAVSKWGGEEKEAGAGLQEPQATVDVSLLQPKSVSEFLEGGDSDFEVEDPYAGEGDNDSGDGMRDEDSEEDDDAGNEDDDDNVSGLSDESDL